VERFPETLADTDPGALWECADGPFPASNYPRDMFTCWTKTLRVSSCRTPPARD